IAIGNALRAAHLRERGEQLLVRHATRALEQRRYLAIGARHRENEVFDRHEVVLELLRLVLRAARDLERPPRERRLGAAGHAGERVDLALREAKERRRVAAGLREEGPSNTAVLLEGRDEEMLGVELGVAAATRLVEGGTEGFLALRSHSVGAHGR